jgi:ferrochelatase
MQATYDALLIVSFGGPEGMDEVMPFLENVLRGRNVPRERMIDVAHHYELFGGVSPINGQNRALIAVLEEEFGAHDLKLPIYWGNRNWQPYLADTLRQMGDDGVQHALAFFTSAYSSYSGCRQYREDIQRAQEEVGIGAGGKGVPLIDKLRVFYNHPGFIAANVERVCAAFEQIPVGRRDKAKLIFTAHSIPMGMAKHSDYVAQLAETSRLVAEGAGHPEWQMAYQSRSGSPRQPWLEPDILAVLRDLQAKGTRDVVVMPVGFISDHMEVLYDLDTEARQLCGNIGLNMIRAGTAGTHPAFIAMIRELIMERMDGGEKRAVGLFAADHDVCPVDCCLAG